MNSLLPLRLQVGRLARQLRLHFPQTFSVDATTLVQVGSEQVLAGSAFDFSYGCYNPVELTNVCKTVLLVRSRNAVARPLPTHRRTEFLSFV